MKSLNDSINLESKKIFFLDYFLLLVPFSIIIGNFAINLNLIIISLILIINLFFNYYYFYFNKQQIFLTISFFIILGLNIYFSEQRNVSFLKFLGILKHILFFISIYICMKFCKNFKNYFFSILIFLLLFVSFDTLIQFFFSRDIFGFEPYIILNSEGLVKLKIERSFAMNILLVHYK